MEAIAVHECGHALVASQTGLRTRWMCIKQDWDGGTSGWTEVADEDHDDPSKRREVLLLLTAGIQAASIWAYRVHRWPARDARRWGQGTGCRDQEMFAHYARGTGFTMAMARSQVTPILAQHWGRITRGSALLVRRQKMPASRV